MVTGRWTTGASDLAFVQAVNEVRAIAKHAGAEFCQTVIGMGVPTLARVRSGGKVGHTIVWHLKAAPCGPT